MNATEEFEAAEAAEKAEQYGKAAMHYRRAAAKSNNPVSFRMAAGKAENCEAKAVEAAKAKAQGKGV